MSRQYGLRAVEEDYIEITDIAITLKALRDKVDKLIAKYGEKSLVLIGADHENSRVMIWERNI